MDSQENNPLVSTEPEARPSFDAQPPTVTPALEQPPIPPEFPSNQAPTQPEHTLATQPAVNFVPSRPKKAPLVLSTIAFILLSLALFVSGPGVWLAALRLQPYAWIISFFYIYVVVGVAIVSIISAILYIIAFSLAFKKKSIYLTNMLIMLSGNIIGLAIMWLSGYNFIRVSIPAAAIIMAACVFLPCAGLILLHNLRSKSITRLETSPKIRITTALALLAMLIETGVAIFYLTQLWQQYIPILEEQHRYEQEQQEQLHVLLEGKDSARQLGPMVFTLCRGGFDIVHQPSDESSSAIVQCDPSGEIYEVGDTQEKNGAYITAHAVYYGTNKNETLEKYFPNQHYLYKNLYNSSYPEEVTLLLPATSIEDVITNYSEPLYDYIQEANQDYRAELLIEIFYNEDLNDVDTTKDYIVLAGTHNIVVDWLPHGNGLAGPSQDYYIFYGLDEVQALNHLAQNPDSYSSQTRNAVKFHPHLSFQVTDGQITLETLMRNSQLCQNNELLWYHCGQ